MFSWLRNRHRRKLLAEPFPSEWETILQRNVGHYPRLSMAEQARLRNITRILVVEKNWEGSQGLSITEEIQVTIAAQAALLLLSIEHQYYERVDSIIVYPGAFRASDVEDDVVSGVAAEGQAVYRGPVILSWNQVRAEGRDPTRGFNVVIHEFAHQLDYLDNVVDGTPPLDDPALMARWRDVMQTAFDTHRQALRQREKSFFTAHAADNETEFFADVTEAFFCRPADLKRFHADIYELLRAYYQSEPLKWFVAE